MFDNTPTCIFRGTKKYFSETEEHLGHLFFISRSFGKRMEHVVVYKQIAIQHFPVKYCNLQKNRLTNNSLGEATGEGPGVATVWTLRIKKKSKVKYSFQSKALIGRFTGFRPILMIFMILNVFTKDSNGKRRLLPNPREQNNNKYNSQRIS